MIYLILKIIFSSFLLVSSAKESNDWFPVENKGKQTEFAQERDSSIWALFLKKIGEERILVRFPDDPTYRYIEEDILEISTTKEGASYFLTVYPVGFDIISQSEAGVKEHFVQTNTHLYHFKGMGLHLENGNFEKFISSFSIEKIS